MKRYVIERDLPGAGELTDQQLHDISARSNEVLEGMSDIEWVQSYVTEDKLYCVYDTEDPALIEEHARRGEFPCTGISAVRAEISPRTGQTGP